MTDLQATDPVDDSSFGTQPAPEIPVFDPSDELAQCDDTDFLRRTVLKLWGIIDDIDSTGDMAKSNDVAYRARVERLQKKRWETGITSDGYKLFYKAAP